MSALSVESAEALVSRIAEAHEVIEAAADARETLAARIESERPLAEESLQRATEDLAEVESVLQESRAAYQSSVYPYHACRATYESAWNRARNLGVTDLPVRIPPMKFDTPRPTGA